MKKCLLLLVALIVVASISFAAEVVRINFDGAPETELATYTLGAGDNLGGGTLDLTSGFAADPYPPDIATPAAAGFQGGNALRVDAADALPSGTDGYCGSGLMLHMGTALTGASTVEAIVWVDAWDKDGGSLTNEYGIVDIIHAPGGGSDANFEIRELGILGGFQLQSQMGAAGEVNGDAGTAPTAAAWHHYAVVWNGTDDLALYVDGTFVVSVNPAWTANLNDLAIGFWANDAGSERALTGYVDAVSIDDTALAPGSFNLPTTPVSDWTIY